MVVEPGTVLRVSSPGFLRLELSWGYFLHRESQLGEHFCLSQTDLKTTLQCCPATHSALIWHLSPGHGHLGPAEKVLLVAPKSCKVLPWRRSQDSTAMFTLREKRGRPQGSCSRNWEGEAVKGKADSGRTRPKGCREGPEDHHLSPSPTAFS